MSELEQKLVEKKVQFWCYPKCIWGKTNPSWDPVNIIRLLWQCPRQNPSLVYPPQKTGSLSGFLLMFIHFSQSNGLWRSDWFYTELNNPKPVQLQSWSSTVRMLTPLNHLKCLHDSIFFTVDDNWIEFPQSGCPFPVCVWRVAMVAGEFGPTLTFT